MKNEIVEFIKGLEEKYGVDTSIQMPVTHSPVPLAQEVADIIEKSAQEVGVTTMRMNSGAGHDAQNMAQKVKTGMLFVPSVNGISHAPMEWTDWDDIEKGAIVLMQALKKLCLL